MVIESGRDQGFDEERLNGGGVVWAENMTNRLEMCHDWLPPKLPPQLSSLFISISIVGIGHR